jgi:hypothetical protein
MHRFCENLKLHSFQARTFNERTGGECSRKQQDVALRIDGFELNSGDKEVRTSLLGGEELGLN